MERRTFLKLLGLAPAVAVPVVTAAAPAPLVMDATPLVAQPLVAAEVLAGIGAEPEAWARITAAALMERIAASRYEEQQQAWSADHGVAAEGIQASNLEAQQRQWSERHGG